MTSPTRRQLLTGLAGAGVLAALSPAAPAAAAVPSVWRFTTSTGQASRIEFPSGWTGGPVPLVIQFKGLGQGGDTFQAPAMATAAKSAGWAIATSNFHGNGYGSPTVMADVRALLAAAAAAGVTFTGLAVWGNSMGGAAALNAVLTRTISVRGLYLTDPVVSLRHRYDNGRRDTINAAYRISSTNPYDRATAGYDPALRPMRQYPLAPIRIVASSRDSLVPMAAHASVLRSKLGSNRVKLLDVGTTGHGTADRFRTTDFADWLRSRRP